MTQGFPLLVFTVQDTAQAKTVYTHMLGVEPYVDQPYYVGFKVGEQEIGLVPNAQKTSITGPLAYRRVEDIASSLKTAIDGGAQLQQDVKNVGGGRLVAVLKDSDGNQLGLMQDP
jgi:predicted enzyme related to lactoylglutathione lyase